MKLKKPLGELLRGNEGRVKRLLRKKLDAEKPSVVVAVGDQTSRILQSVGVKANLYVYDGKIKRAKVAEQILPVDKTVKVRNAAGTLTDEALKAVSEALQFRDSRGCRGILVDGEEDLLTLAGILYAPEGSLILYGQPDEGMVVVKVTSQKKRFAEEIIGKMRVEG